MPEQEPSNGYVPAIEEEVEELTRRKFAARAGLGAVGMCYAAAFGYPVYRYLAAPAEEAAELAKITEVSIPRENIPPPGSVLMFKFGPKPAMLIHHKDGQKVCFSAICTHLGCTVQYRAEGDHIHCACHGGEYDSRTGRNVGGPPPKPLTPFEVVEETPDGPVIVKRI